MDSSYRHSDTAEIPAGMAWVARCTDALRRRATEIPGFHEKVRHPWAALGPGAIALLIDDLLRDALERAWERGWRPAEVARAVRRRWSSLHVDLTATAVASDHSRRRGAPADWLEEIAELGATTTWWGSGRDWLSPWTHRSGVDPLDALATALEVLGVVISLPPVAHIQPPPSMWGASGGVRTSSGIDQAVLAKVRALLAKAESTSFEAEAEAFTAKAQDLMARYSIDEALARTSVHDGRGSGAGRPDRGSAGSGPSARRVPVENPYAGPKSTLLSVTARANGVSAIWQSYFCQMTLVGFECDIQAVQLLYTSLLMQASKSLQASGQVKDWRGRSRTRSFRHSFYLSYAYRIRERLDEATMRARRVAAEESGQDLLPALAARDDAVEARTKELFPHARTRRTSAVTNGDGWRAGRAAADMARLSPDRPSLDRTA